MNTLLTETTSNKEILINLDNVDCFVREEDKVTLVFFNDDTHTSIKEEFDDIVDMLHGD